jgi:hypothetical protein
VQTRDLSPPTSDGNRRTSNIECFGWRYHENMLVARYNWITFVSSVGSVHDVGPPDMDDHA